MGEEPLGLSLGETTKAFCDLDTECRNPGCGKLLIGLICGSKLAPGCGELWMGHRKTGAMERLLPRNAALAIRKVRKAKDHREKDHREKDHGEKGHGELADAYVSGQHFPCLVTSRPEE